MEEKKKKEVKAVEKKLSVKSNAQEKLSYEDLEKVAQSLSQQCQVYQQRINEAEKVINSFNDIGMLLSILKEAEYFDELFINRCAGKIQEFVSGLLDTSEAPSDKN